ncbi:MAG: hypothetical protein WBM08_06625 [Prochlorococcaceae cyanobacterium]
MPFETMSARTPAHSMARRHWRSLGVQHSPWQRLWRQPVSMVMRMPWPLFFLAMTGLYLVELVVFTLAFQLDAGHLEGMGAMGLPASLVFALQNLFSASFRAAELTSGYGLGVAALERLVGLLTNAMVTGLFFLRFTRVDVPLTFSRALCLSSWSGGHLSCRFVTRDPTHWLKVSYGMFLFRDEEIEPGVVQRRVETLPVLNGQTPQLQVTAVISHRLSPDSPLLRLGLDGLQRANGLLMVQVEGTDAVTGAPLLQVNAYHLADIRVGEVFADLVSLDASGRRQVDLDALDRTRPYP